MCVAPRASAHVVGTTPPQNDPSEEPASGVSQTPLAKDDSCGRQLWQGRAVQAKSPLPGRDRPDRASLSCTYCRACTSRLYCWCQRRGSSGGPRACSRWCTDGWQVCCLSQGAPEGTAGSALRHGWRPELPRAGQDACTLVRHGPPALDWRGLPMSGGAGVYGMLEVATHWRQRQWRQQRRLWVVAIAAAASGCSRPGLATDRDSGRSHR